MSEQSDRVDALTKKLIDAEVRRRQAVRDGDRDLHNRLANQHREIIGQIPVHDLRSIVTGWLLELGKAADERAQADTPS